VSLLGGLKTLLGGEGSRGKPMISKKDDPALKAAAEAARATISTFWAHFDAKDRETFLIKVRVPLSDDRAEQLWVAPVDVAENGSITGILINEPIDVPNLRHGSSMTVAPGQITDWSYWNGETLYGNFTTRVFLPSLTRGEQADLLSVLSENPVESA
jgi:uncharacterized protein YegJ (DUF2314 family)